MKLRFVFILLFISMSIISNAIDLNHFIKRHLTEISKAEQLQKRLLQDANTIKWKVELSPYFSTISLAVNSSKGDYDILIRTINQETEIVVNGTSKKQIEEYYKAIIEKEKGNWFSILETHKDNLLILEEIFNSCPIDDQFLTVLFTSDVIHVTYSNMLHAKSLDHKENYHMLTVDCTIKDVLTDVGFDEVVLNKNVKVRLQDGSSINNQQCGTDMANKIKELKAE